MINVIQKTIPFVSLLIFSSSATALSDIKIDKYLERIFSIKEPYYLMDRGKSRFIGFSINDKVFEALKSQDISSNKNIKDYSCSILKSSEVENIELSLSNRRETDTINYHVSYSSCGILRKADRVKFLEDECFMGEPTSEDYAYVEKEGVKHNQRFNALHLSEGQKFMMESFAPKQNIIRFNSSVKKHGLAEGNLVRILQPFPAPMKNFEDRLFEGRITNMQELNGSLFVEFNQQYIDDEVSEFIHHQLKCKSNR